METFCGKRKSEVQSPARAEINRPKRRLQAPPQDPEQQNDIGDAMVDWAHLDTSFVIQKFALKLMMNPSKLFKLEETNDYFADCLTFSRLMLFVRRMERCDSKEHDNTWIIKEMPLYNQEYKDFVLKNTKQSREDLTNAHSKTTFTLCNCLRWPSSDQVQPRIDHDNVRNLDEEAKP